MYSTFFALFPLLYSLAGKAAAPEARAAAVIEGGGTKADANVVRGAAIRQRADAGAFHRVGGGGGRRQWRQWAAPRRVGVGLRAAAARLFQPRAPFSLLYSLAVDVHYMLDDGTPCDKSAPGAVKHVTGGAAAKGA